MRGGANLFARRATNLAREALGGAAAGGKEDIILI